MKKILLILFALLLIGTGCFHNKEKSDEEKPEIPAEANSYQHAEFSISPPKEWEQITTFTKEYPEGTLVAFRDKIRNDAFTANITIFKQDIETELTSIDFALEEIRKHEVNLLNFEEFSREIIKINIAENFQDTLLIYFQGKQNPEENIIKYMQIYGVKGKEAYIATAAFDPKELDIITQEAEKALRSFIVK